MHDQSQYAFAQYADFAGATDLQGLKAAFDSNGDGVFNQLDVLYGQFAVWQDLDQNGVSNSAEVRSLADWGIASIKLDSDGVVRAPAFGVQEFGRSTVQMTDGSEMVLADAAFAFETPINIEIQPQAKAEDLPESGDSLKLFLQDMVHTASTQEETRGELFASADVQAKAPELGAAGFSMDLLSELEMRAHQV